MLLQCAILYNFYLHGSLRFMHSLIADSEVWGSYDIVPGLALCPVPVLALTLPARRAAVLAHDARDSQVNDRRVLWLPCMGPGNPATLGIPVFPTKAVGVTLTLSGLRVCLPPGFERKLLLIAATNREVELGLRVSSASLSNQ